MQYHPWFFSPFVQTTADIRTTPDYRRQRRSGSANDDFQVFAGHHHRAIVRAVELRDERQKILLEFQLCRRLQRAERLQDRTVVGPEHFEPMRRRAIAKYEVSWCCLD